MAISSSSALIIAGCVLVALTLVVVIVCLINRYTRKTKMKSQPPPRWIQKTLVPGELAHLIHMEDRFSYTAACGEVISKGRPHRLYDGDQMVRLSIKRCFICDGSIQRRPT